MNLKRGNMIFLVELPKSLINQSLPKVYKDKCIFHSCIKI